MAQGNLNIGIAGAGAFARFAAQAFLNAGEINIVAVEDIDENAAREMASSLSAKSYSDFDLFLADSTIDLVYIATPPFLHYAQSKSALLANKHVICEKPAALKASEAKELALLAQSRNLLYVVNLMQRYNPLFSIVRSIVHEKLLGNFLHGFFENYASDENLHPSHWFWDEQKSGGIFIEHGVHFFDLFSGWLGPGEVVSAFRMQREHDGKKIADCVQATVHYSEGLVNFYHGFDQPKILDRQELRLLFEHGEITLYGWIPVRMKLHGLLSASAIQQLEEIPGKSSIKKHDTGTPPYKVNGRFKEIIFDEHITVEYGNDDEKEKRYSQMLTAMITDQREWIRNSNHKRVIDEQNAIASLSMAEDATRISIDF